MLRTLESGKSRSVVGEREQEAARSDGKVCCVVEGDGEKGDDGLSSREISEDFCQEKERFVRQTSYGNRHWWREEEWRKVQGRGRGVEEEVEGDDNEWMDGWMAIKGSVCLCLPTTVSLQLHTRLKGFCATGMRYSSERISRQRKTGIKLTKKATETKAIEG
ncbi:hypothetical protein BJX70DRAFT_179352 [Aspergillus crustosus]